MVLGGHHTHPIDKLLDSQAARRANATIR